jgi:RNA polymerase sigma factor (sigma-70 family)
MPVTLPPFQRLVDDHWRDVARLAYSMAGANEAEDVAQQAWAKALAAYPSLSDARNLKGWLMTITARTAIDATRRRARRPRPAEVLPERATPPGAETDEELWSQVRCLPERQRSAVALHYVADLSHKEVADVLGTTAAASRRLVSDALGALRASLVPGRSEEVGA